MSIFKQGAPSKRHDIRPYGVCLKRDREMLWARSWPDWVPAALTLSPVYPGMGYFFIADVKLMGPISGLK